MKNETLEEAAETHAFNFYEKEDRPLSEHSFKAGAKWQAERMYSEEEVKVIVNKVRETGLTVEYLLLTEQFKS